MKFLQQHELDTLEKDIQNIRRQEYDKCVNIKGCNSEVQQLLQKSLRSLFTSHRHFTITI